MKLFERILNLAQSVTALSIFIFLILGTKTQSVKGNSLNEIDPFGLDTDPVLMASLESPEQHQLHGNQPQHSAQRQQLFSHPHGGEKRAWDRLQGSWGKRDLNNIDDYESNQFSGIDDIPEYDDANYNAIKYAILFRHTGAGLQDQIFQNEQKRGWKAMNGAWGKRLSGSGDWNKFRGSWGKRETGNWNGLKGLWGKRSAQWDKLNSAWGK